MFCEFVDRGLQICCTGSFLKSSEVRRLSRRRGPQLYDFKKKTIRIISTMIYKMAVSSVLHLIRMISQTPPEIKALSVIAKRRSYEWCDARNII
jgi:hypothetical protein